MAKDEKYWRELVKEAVAGKGERNDLDFNADVSTDNARLREHINAFAHESEGGCFVFGVDESQGPYKYTGDTLDFDSIQRKLANIATSTQEPPLGVANYVVPTSIGDVLCIHIYEGTTKPVFIKDRGPFTGRACFKRTGASTVPMSIEEIRILLSQSTGQSYDETTVPESSLADLDPKILFAVDRSIATGALSFNLGTPYNGNRPSLISVEVN